ncbi:MAG: hypothetical protein GXC73_09395 [Chitinophagaceae bacterium]|nr:hypothetical protein [Chitinophagaceae bacterium]
MKLRNFTPILTVIILAATSCKKEGSENSSSLLSGNWKFVSATGSTTVTNSVTFGSDVMKTEATTSFTSSNPKGSYNMTATQITGNGIGYDFTGSSITKVYTNNVLLNQLTVPTTGTIPPTNLSSTYKLIGTDSLYFETKVPGTANAGGCKFKLEGTKLTLFMKINTKSFTDIGGATVSADNIHVNTTIILQKQ